VQPAEAIAFLREYNAWRRGGDDSEMPQPYQIGQAIDALCDHAERMERELAAGRALADRLAQEYIRLAYDVSVGALTPAKVYEWLQSNPTGAIAAWVDACFVDD